MGIYVMLVIGGIRLLLSGLSAAYYFITLDWEEAEGCSSHIKGFPGDEYGGWIGTPTAAGCTDGTSSNQVVMKSGSTPEWGI
jgi:hypothetical protein